MSESWFRIYYQHRDCPVNPGVKWEDEWSCACNGECPACHIKDIEPVDWEDVLNIEDTGDRNEQKDCES